MIEAEDNPAAALRFSKRGQIVSVVAELGDPKDAWLKLAKLLKEKIYKDDKAVARAKYDFRRYYD